MGDEGFPDGGRTRSVAIDEHVPLQGKKRVDDYA